MARPSGSGLETLGLFTGILGPPFVWAIRFGVVYVLVPYACANERMWALHVITAVTLLIIGAITVAAWRRWRTLRGTESSEVESRIAFMALAGVLSGAFFFLVVVAEGLANWFIDPCQQAGMPIA